jgi:uncharacterized membrane protein
MPAKLVSLLEIIAAFIELIGVSVLVAGFLICFGRYLRHCRRVAPPDPLQEFKHGIGRAVLVGLEILVASTIIKIVMVELTFVSVGLITGMIAVRTIISWSIILEHRGRLPWEPGPRIREGNSNGA